MNDIVKPAVATPWPDPRVVDKAAEDFIASTTYVVSASLLSPHGRVIGRLERSWQGAFTIGDLAMKLITNSQERTDLDQCKIEIRWRKG